MFSIDVYVPNACSALVVWLYCRVTVQHSWFSAINVYAKAPPQCLRAGSRWWVEGAQANDGPARQPIKLLHVCNSCVDSSEIRLYMPKSTLSSSPCPPGFVFDFIIVLRGPIDPICSYRFFSAPPLGSRCGSTRARSDRATRTRVSPE